MSLIGYDRQAQTPLQTQQGKPTNEHYFSLAQYLNRSEYWKMDSGETGKNRLILGRFKKAEVGIYWDGQQFAHELIWVIVEP